MKKVAKKVLALFCTAALGLGSMNFGMFTVKAAAPDLSEGLTGYWNFEHVSEDGLTVNNEVSGGKVGTLSGNNVSVVDSKFGKALHFAEGTEGRMTIAGFNSQASDFSISMWYKLAEGFNRGEKSVVLLQQDGNGKTLLSLKGNNQYHTYINKTDVLSNGTVSAPAEWQHVVFAYDKDTKEVSFYINGKLDSTKSAGTVEIVNAETNLLIGRHKNSVNDPLPMRGDVDEIRLYNKTVTAEDAQALYEDKAKLVLFEQLQTLITEAEALYEEGLVPSEDEAAQALKDKIDAAKALTESASATAIREMTDALQAAMRTYSANQKVVLSIDTDKVEREIDDSIFGINHRYAFNGYGSFDSKTMQIKEDFEKLYAEAGFGSIRYPGGTISNLFRWKDSLGEVEKRTKQIHGFYNNSGQGGIAPTFGLNEVATFAEKNNSEIVYVYGFGRGSAQDASDLVEYLNAPVGLNPNGGVDWAAVRAENGHPQPFGLRYFEIGNENNQGGANGAGDGTWSQQYWMSYVSGKGAEDAYIHGGRVNITKQYAVRKDDWNQAVSGSDGSPNQTRYMRYANPNPMTVKDGEICLDDTFEAVIKDSVHIYVNDEEWTITDSFANAANTAKVVTVDYRDGSFTFGNGTNGAIPPSGASIKVSYQVDRDGFVEVSKQMKETMKKIDAEKECNIYSSWESQGFVNKMASTGNNAYYDGLTIHPYSGTPSGSGTAFYDSAMSLAESAGVGKVQSYVNMLPKDKVPVISEYGIFRSQDPLLRSQTHAIYIAKVLMEYVRLGSPYIQKHCLVDWYSNGADSLGPTQQAVIQAVKGTDANTTTGEGTFTFFSTPSARVFEMLNSGFGTEVLASKFSTTETLPNGVKAYSALASRDKDGNYYVAMVNVNREDGKTFELNLGDSFDASGKEIVVHRLETDSYDAANTPENPNYVDVETQRYTNEGKNVSIQMQPHSFVVVKIESDKKPATLESITVEAPTKTEYEIGEKLDLTGMVVTATYSDQTTTDVTEQAEVTGFDSETAGEQTITVTYEGKTATFNVTVKEKEDPQPPVDEVDKDALNAAIKEAEDKKEEDYTAESWKAFAEALEAAKKTAKDEKASQTEVDAAKDALVKAQEALVKAGDDTDKPIEEIFDDVREGDWYYEYVDWAYKNKIMTGYGNSDSFGPANTLNRAEFAKILYNYAGTPEVEFEEVLKDVKEGDWYADAVIWAYGEGVITGYTDTKTFGATDEITREQIATILYRYAKEPKVENEDILKDFPDAKKVSDFAKEAMMWAVENEIITGDNGNLNPGGNANRAEAAAIMMRVIPIFSK